MGIKEDHLNHFLSLNGRQKTTIKGCVELITLFLVTLNSLVKWSDVLNQDEKEYIMNMFDLQSKLLSFLFAQP